jgi:hypothetical protein
MNTEYELDDYSVLNFSYDLDSFDTQYMYLKVNFEDPMKVSVDSSYPETMSFMFYNMDEIEEKQRR